MINELTPMMNCMTSDAALHIVREMRPTFSQDWCQKLSRGLAHPDEFLPEYNIPDLVMSREARRAAKEILQPPMLSPKGTNGERRRSSPPCPPPSANVDDGAVPIAVVNRIRTAAPSPNGKHRQARKKR